MMDKIEERAKDYELKGTRAMKHTKIQKQIIEDCKKAGACKEEFKKLLSATSDKEFWDMINKNMGWCLVGEVIRDEYFQYLTITDDYYKYLYCRDVRDKKEVWSTITDDHYKYLYCLNVRDREELWSTITDDHYKYLYCRDVKDRKELK